MKIIKEAKTLRKFRNSTEQAFPKMLQKEEDRLGNYTNWRELDQQWSQEPRPPRAETLTTVSQGRSPRFVPFFLLDTCI